jgi:hypothetical protein
MQTINRRCIDRRGQVMTGKEIKTDLRKQLRRRTARDRHKIIVSSIRNKTKSLTNLLGEFC